MAETIFDSTARAVLQSRIDRLVATTTPRWGRFTAPKMVSHLIDAARMAVGDRLVKPKRSFMSNPVVRYLAIYVLPWPRGAPTARELLDRAPESWPADIAALKGLLDRVGTMGPAGAFHPHPLFGSLSGAEWGALIHRHVDHHLTQFGV